MAFADKTLTCRDCGNQFTFTVGEQEFHQSRGFENEPGRCPDCRAARRASGGGRSYGEGGGGYGGGGGGYRSERTMYPAVCDSCKKETQVPFQPRQDRPVYCSECYSARGGGGDRRPSGGGERRRW